MRLALFFSILVVFGASATAQAPLIQSDADHAVIYDYKTGQVLYSKAGDVPMIPASMTKIMTVQVVFERLKTGELTLEDRFTVSENAWRKGGARSGGSTMFLEPGDRPTVEELLRGVMILSGNDACIVLAEGIAGSEEVFASEMSHVAKSLGLDSASFKNSTGLDADGHRISAVDLAKLSALQIRDFPSLYALYAEPSYEWRGIRQPNRNPLLGKTPGADGVKTGHLSVSGYGLVGSAVKEGERRIIVINGLDSSAARAREAERLMRSAFSAYETRRLEPAAGPIASVDVELGRSPRVGLELSEPIEVLAHKRALSRMKTEIVYEGPLLAPIEAGQSVARLVVSVEGETLVEAPLLATENVAALGFFGRVVAGLSALMQGGDE